MTVVISNAIVTNPAGAGALTSNPEIPLDAPNLISSQSAGSVSAPNVLSASSAGAMSAPNIIPAIAYTNTPPFPLNHARILYSNLLLGSTVSSTDGSGDSLTLSPNTFERWSFTDSENITYEMAFNDDIDTVCIGAHNLSGSTVELYYSTTSGGSLTLAGTANPVDNSSIMFHLTNSVSMRDVEIRVAGTGDRYMGSVYAGIALQMQRPFFAGFAPVKLNAVTDYFSSRTESGEFIGRQIRRRGYESSCNWKFITDAWYREYYQPFVESAKIYPFYIAWNLLEQDADVAYCWTDSDLTVSYSGTLDFVEMTLPLKAHS